MGAAYLVWLGAQTLLSVWIRRNAPSKTTERRALLSGGPYVQGTLTNVLNPKLAIFFLTFVPQFVTPGSPQSAQILLLSVVFVGMTALWLTTYVLTMDRLSGVLSKPTVKRWFDTVVGTVLVALGLRLALENSI